MISADSGRSAKRGCYLAAGLTLVVGLAVSLIGLSAFYFGRDPGSSLLIDLALSDLPGLVGGGILLGLFWRKANTPGALAGVIAGSVARMTLHFAVADAYRGLDTLLAPVFSLAAMVTVSLLTQAAYRPRHDELKRVPSERDLVAGLDGA